jgi:hypothetical protein
MIVGLLLAAAPEFAGPVTSGAAFAASFLGSLSAVFSVLAIRPPLAFMRWGSALAGIGIFVAAWNFRNETLFPIDIIAGLITLGLSIPDHDDTRDIGGGWTAVFHNPPDHSSLNLN